MDSSSSNLIQFTKKEKKNYYNNNNKKAKKKEIKKLVGSCIFLFFVWWQKDYRKSLFFQLIKRNTAALSTAALFTFSFVLEFSLETESCLRNLCCFYSNFSYFFLVHVHHDFNSTVDHPDCLKGHTFITFAIRFKDERFLWGSHSFVGGQLLAVVSKQKRWSIAVIFKIS